MDRFDECLVEEVAGVAEGVGAVEDDDSRAEGLVGGGLVGGGVVFGWWWADDQADSIEDSLAVLVGEIERILLHELEGVDLDVL